MAIPVEMHDGRRLEFPDGTAPAVIQATVKRLIAESGSTGAQAAQKSSEKPGLPRNRDAVGIRALDGPNAVATGYNAGLARLVGMPVDTAANILDLGKAALGTPWLLAGKVPPNALIPGDRGDVPFSGQWNINKLGGNRLTAPIITASNPEYDGGWAQTLGGGLSSILNPQTRAQLVNQGVLGVTAALSSRAAHEGTGSNALAITAGMLPYGVQQVATQGAKYAVRGGESGRAQMEQRVADLKSVGVDKPTLGLASGNKSIGGVENLLQNTPGAVGIMRQARDAAVGGVESTVLGAANAASTNRGHLASGQAIQSGLKQFRETFKAKQNELYDKVESKVGGQFPTNVDKTSGTLEKLNADIPNAEALSKFFKNGTIQSLEAAFKEDINRTRAYTPSQIKEAVSSNPRNLSEFNSSLGEGALPFQAVKQVRTLVGNELTDSNLISPVPRSKWNPLYGALSDDMQTAAAKAGPSAATAFNRASDHTRSGFARLDRVAPIGDRVAPEQSSSALKQALKDNVSTFEAVKKSLPEGARGQVAATIIDELGTATPGKQNAEGTVWSPETFLTNWNRIAPAGQKALLSGFPNAEQVASDITAAARATAMMRDNAKLWANPSGTGANAFARGSIGGAAVGALGAAMGVVPYAVPLVAGGTMLGANAAARALTNQKIINELMRSPETGPNATNLLQSQLIGSFGDGRLDRDRQKR